MKWLHQNSYKLHCNDCREMKMYKPIRRKGIGEVRPAGKRCHEFEAGKQASDEWWPSRRGKLKAKPAERVWEISQNSSEGWWADSRTWGLPACWQKHWWDPRWMPYPSLAGEKSTFLEKFVQERTRLTCYSEKGGFSEWSIPSMVIPTPSAQIPKGSQSGSYQPG